MKTWLAILVLIFTSFAVKAQVTDVVLRPGEIPKDAFRFLLFAAVGGANPTISPPGVDPGVRTGAAGIGGLLPGITTGTGSETNLQQVGMFWFSTEWSVTGSIVNTIPGLGARYNTTGCSACHAYPAPGGTSPLVNNELAMATLRGATNTVPIFITSNSPTITPWRPSTQESDFLYTIQGRSDAGTCTLAQPNWAAIVAAGDVFFMQPVELAGDGLVEATPSSTLVSQQATIPGGATWTFAGLGITTGRFSQTLGGIQTIGRKARASSILDFAYIAQVLEIGSSNALYPRKASEAAGSGCNPNGLPEDGYRTTRLSPNSTSLQGDYSEQAQLAANAVRYLAPPATASTGYTACPPLSPGCASPTTVVASDIAAGQTQFINVGCVACHTQSHTTGLSAMTGQSGVTYSSWSDHALHDMGDGLSNGITLGAAGPRDWKTAALWGLGQRIYLLHDGRTTDMNAAIQAHLSNTTHPSEANAVINAFNNLPTVDQQQILDFLRSL